LLIGVEIHSIWFRTFASGNVDRLLNIDVYQPSLLEWLVAIHHGLRRASADVDHIQHNNAIFNADELYLGITFVDLPAPNITTAERVGEIASFVQAKECATDTARQLRAVRLFELAVRTHRATCADQ
jgi:hypothetical protein